MDFLFSSAICTYTHLHTMEGVTVDAENPLTGDIRSICSAYFTFVARPRARRWKKEAV